MTNTNILKIKSLAILCPRIILIYACLMITPTALSMGRLRSTLRTVLRATISNHALRHAVARKDAEMTRQWLRRGANPNTRTEKGLRLLHVIALNSDSDVNVMRVLLEEGANPNVRHRDDNSTPLHFAAACGLTEKITVLLKNGANPYDRTVHGNTPLQLGAIFNWPETVRTLLEAGASMTPEE